MFRCGKNLPAVCIICVGAGIILSAILTKFTLFCGTVVLVIGICLLLKGRGF